MQELAKKYESRGLKTFLVFVGGQELEADIAKLATEKQITEPMTFLAGGASPTAFKINPEAKNTFLTYNLNRVTANFVDVTEADFAKIEKAAAAMLK